MSFLYLLNESVICLSRPIVRLAMSPMRQVANLYWTSVPFSCDLPEIAERDRISIYGLNKRRKKRGPPDKTPSGKPCWAPMIVGVFVMLDQALRSALACKT